MRVFLSENGCPPTDSAFSAISEKDGGVGGGARALRCGARVTRSGYPRRIAFPGYPPTASAIGATDEIEECLPVSSSDIRLSS